MEKEWQKFSSILKDLLELESSPVAVTRFKAKLPSQDKKVRICKAILDAARGGVFNISRENNACFVIFINPDNSCISVV